MPRGTAETVRESIESQLNNGPADSDLLGLGGITLCRIWLIELTRDASIMAFSPCLLFQEVSRSEHVPTRTLILRSVALLFIQEHLWQLSEAPA